MPLKAQIETIFLEKKKRKAFQGIINLHSIEILKCT